MPTVSIVRLSCVLLCVLIARSAYAETNACDPALLNEQILNLFPPAGEDQRIAALRQLTECRDQRLAGPMTAVLQGDPKPAVRAEAIASLAKTGGPLARESLVRVVKSTAAPTEMWEAAAKGLIELREAETVRAILFDWQAPPQQRTTALKLLDAAQPLPREELEFLSQEGAGRLKSMATGLLAAREPPKPTATPELVEPPKEAPAPEEPKVAVEEPKVAVEEPKVSAPPEEPPEVKEPLAEVTPPPLPRANDTLPIAPPSDEEWAKQQELSRPKISDGTALAVTTSTVAGASLMSFLTLLGQQDSTGVLLLTGTAGAVIGGGTAWGLTRFNVLRPTLAQSAWYTNVTGWGTLAGLAVYSGSGLQSDKAKWGLLVGGQGLGMVAGAVTAKYWEWTPGEMVLADSMLLSLGLTDAGIKSLRGEPPGLTTRAAIGIVPAMLGSAMLARAIKPTGEDLQLIGTMTVASSVTGSLLASGWTRENAFTGSHARGGFLTGLGLGYMGTVIAAGLSEASPSRSWLALSTMVIGNALGRGAHMVAQPDDVARWNLGAGLGGLAVGTAAFIAAPHMRFRGSTIPMMLSGAIYGSGVWGLSSYASYHGQALTPEERTQFKGSLLVGGAAGGLAGLIASQWFSPDAGDYLSFGALTTIGFSTGLGVARLASPTQGTSDQLGSLIGSAVGMIAGAALLHSDKVRWEDHTGAFVGGAYGTLIGTFVPTLGDESWSGGRSTQGGLYAGFGLGSLAGGVIAHATNATSEQVNMTALAGLFGVAMGTGAGWMWPMPEKLSSPFTEVSFDTNSRAARIGTIGGPLLAMGGAMLLERKLHLSEGLGPSATMLGLEGAAWGTVYGTLLAATIDPSGQLEETPGSRMAGGALFGVSTGLATGLVLSKAFEPQKEDLVLANTSALMGGALGYGVSLLATEKDGRANSLGLLLGSAAGLGTGAWAARYVRLTNVDRFADAVGTGFGTVLGALLPSIASAEWQANRTTGGSALVGGVLLGSGATAYAHWKELSVGEVMVPMWAGVFGGVMGAGLGGMLPLEGSQPARVGAVIGMPTLVATSMLLERKLRLSEGLGENAGRFGFTGGAIGTYLGLLLAPAINGLNDTASEQGAYAFSGMVFGSALGTASGLVASKFYSLNGPDQGVAMAGTLLGSGFGWGLGMVATEESGRTEATMRLSGALLGLGGAIATQRLSPLTKEDGVAGFAAGSYGAFLGALVPSLGEAEWSGFDRKTTGWTMFGASALTMGGIAARHLTGASNETIGLGTLGALDGMMTGAGFGMLVANTSQSNRVGVALGSLAGLGIGLSAWPKAEPTGADGGFITASTILGGWTGLWLGTLQRPHLGEAPPARVWGGALAGAGLASFASSLVGPRLHVDPDLTINATAMDALFSAAGLGAGLLASDRDNVATGTMLAAGTAGLLLGGVLHNHIEANDEMAPLVTLATFEGAFIGGFLPSALRPMSEVTTRQQVGGLLAGTFTGAGLSILASSKLRLSASQAGFAGTTSAVGGALAGGVALVNEDWSSQAKVATMLGGTTVGLVGGALLGKKLAFEANPAPRVALGVLLGVAEGLTFAWAGHAETPGQWSGAGLVGAGVGATLGLASAAYPYFTSREAPATAGFAAWGAWMGSFTGSLVKQDARNVTMGGLLGANVGALGGYALVRSGAIQAADFGWLSLFGGIGTVIGAGIGAPFATKQDARPVLAGLAIGPAVGLVTGYFLLPKLRAAIGSGAGGESTLVTLKPGWRVEQ